MTTTTHDDAAHGHGQGHGAADDGEVHAHISSTQFYVGVLGGLLFLTFLTVYVSYFDFGEGNVIIAIVIATLKASLVAAFFMHLRHDRIFHTIAFLAAFLFLSIFLLLTRDDLYRRAEIDPNYGGHVELRSGLAAPGGMPSSAPAPAESGAPGEKH